VTTPGVGSKLDNIWFITSPESALKPVIFPDVRLAVQLNVAPGTLDVKGMFVDSPEQMDFEAGNS